jgi:hypothetical protein
MNEPKDVKELAAILKLRLNISRVPEPTRSQFIEFANGEFAGDYGMCLMFIWDAFKHYQQIINTQDTKIDYLINMVEQLKSNSSASEPAKKQPRFLTPKQLNEDGGKI